MSRFLCVLAPVFLFCLAFTGCNSTTTSTALTLSASSTTVSYGGTITVTASGGTSPYTYSVSSGGGNIASSTGVYTAPSDNESVTLVATDATGATANLTITVSDSLTTSSSLAFTNTATTIVTGQTLTLGVSGGSSPYTYAIVSGSGSLSGATFTAGSSSDSTLVRVTDASGSTAEITLRTLALTTLSSTAKVWVDYQVGITFDTHESSLDTQSLPQLILFGTGSGSDTAALAANGSNCQVGGGAEILSPCAVRIPLENLDRTGSIALAYKGNVTVSGRDKSISFEFCVRPTEPNRAYINWTQTSSLVYRNLNYNLTNLTLLEGRSLRSAYNIIDSSSNASYANVQLSNAHYTSSDTCGTGYTSSHYIEASAN